jgi:NAD(P)-dependent dehydrogenase (short-subunit alcohol dehydrogenase family)
VITGRDDARGEAARARILARHPSARLRFALLDLASLASVRNFAARQDRALALLVNNAGVMAIPDRHVTADGFEMQFGVNHLGHFALTGLLLPALRGGRLVVVASLAHRRGRMRLDDLQGERVYDPWRAYTQSKLANLMFAREFHRRSAAWNLCVVAAHPGWAATNIMSAGPRMGRVGLRTWLGERLMPLFGQSGAAGARPILFAATEGKCGEYYGPAHFGERRGPPVRAHVAPAAEDAATAAALWRISEELTGVRYT